MLRELTEGVTVEEIRLKTGAPVVVPNDMGSVTDAVSLDTGTTVADPSG